MKTFIFGFSYPIARTIFVKINCQTPEGGTSGVPLNATPFALPHCVANYKLFGIVTIEKNFLNHALNGKLMGRTLERISQ